MPTCSRPFRPRWQMTWIREGRRGSLSSRSYDRKGRWRNLTVAFRVSPEEREEIRTRVKLSGLTQQEYIIRRLQDQDIVVVGSPRLYKALKEQMRQIFLELQRIEKGGEVSQELQETIRLVTKIYDGMKSR